MTFAFVEADGGWRWILRDGVEVRSKGAVLPTRKEAEGDAHNFKVSVALATLLTEGDEK